MLTNPEDRAPASAAKDVVLLLLALVVLVGSMAVYWVYPYPSGNRPDMWGFVVLFFREALLLAFFGVIGFFLLGVAIVRASIRVCVGVRLKLRSRQ